ncbi:MAG: hypothetical protein HZB53_17650 [Chloroflexi bacterium]|nr:hypothetical protein [Chloroflexota bacterium]
MALFLTEQDVTALLTMPDALVCVEEAFREQGRAAAQNLPRRRLRPPKGVLHLMAGALPTLGVMGYKAYSTTRSGAKFHVMLYSTDTGELLAACRRGLHFVVAAPITISKPQDAVKKTGSPTGC